MAVGALGATSAHGACVIKMYGQLQLEPTPGRTFVKGAANGHAARFLADTGADLTSISTPDAVSVGAAMRVRPGLDTYGVGGSVGTKVSSLDLTLGRTTVKGEAVMVLDGPASKAEPTVILGRDLLLQHDLELDLPDQAIRFLQPTDCKAAELVYWNKPYSQVRLESDGSDHSAILVNVLLNGHIVPAMIDSGASTSVVTPEAAALAGVPYNAGEAREHAHGIGPHAVDVRVASFDSFTLGDETIKNVRIRIADLWKYNKIEETGTRLGYEQSVQTPKMLLGADFLAAHRAFVARSQNLIVFSYVGGPVFDVPPEAKSEPQAAPAAR